VQEQRRELVERQPHAGRAVYKGVDTAEVKQTSDGQDRTRVGVCWLASYLFGRRVSAEAGLCRACSAWVHAADTDVTGRGVNAANGCTQQGESDVPAASWATEGYTAVCNMRARVSGTSGVSKRGTGHTVYLAGRQGVCAQPIAPPGARATARGCCSRAGGRGDLVQTRLHPPRGKQHNARAQRERGEGAEQGSRKRQGQVVWACMCTYAKSKCTCTMPRSLLAVRPCTWPTTGDGYIIRRQRRT